MKPNILNVRFFIVHKYRMKENEKNLNECEGGAGEPGSGDLPLPSGKLYKQVAPFDTFLKSKKKRKKLKKQKHTPNSPHYAYVDDFKTYVERTYTKMDKFK